MSEANYIVVIGASAGGLGPITELVSALPVTPAAAYFVVLHISARSNAEVIAQHLSKHTSIDCSVAGNERRIEGAHLYVAPPDMHLMVKRGAMTVNKGPQENRWRPSIDVLFRSAAAAYNSSVTGIVLSGLLDDGTAGMIAIKRCGGTCIIQEPSEAEFPDMPRNVINNVDVDYSVPVKDMRYVLDDLFSKQKPETSVPPEIKFEAEITERMSSDMSNLSKIGKQSPYICPDCGGGLWEIEEGKLHRYRCHTGHVYNETVLANKQLEALEESLWVSIRMMEERRNLLRAAADHSNSVGVNMTAKNSERVTQLEEHINRLKEFMFSLGQEK